MIKGSSKMLKPAVRILAAALITAALAAAGVAAALHEKRAAVVVHDPAELAAAVKAAKAGDVILLAPGRYAGVSIHGFNAGGPVTLRSQDPAHLASLTAFEIVGSHGLRLSDLELVTSAPVGFFNFRLEACEDIRLSNLNIHGTLDGNPQNDSEGVSILNSSRIAVVDSEFQQLQRAMGVGASHDVELIGNTFHDLRTTGVMIAATSDIHILRNSFTDFFPVALDHPDAIQFLTTGVTKAAQNILIADNVVLRGRGAGVQGIFLRDEAGGIPYDGVRILRNYLYGTGYNGIAVLGGRNIEIANNTLVSFSGPTQVNWILTQNVERVASHDNEAAKIGYDKTTDVSDHDNRTNPTVSGVAEEADSVISRASYVMPPHVRRLWLAGRGLTGTADSKGGATLTSLQGGNTLVGGAGGGDVFQIHHADDVIQVAPGTPNETVRTSVSYQAPANVSGLVGEGDEPLDLEGNALDNTIVAARAGGALTGGGGNDTFVFSPGHGKWTVNDFDGHGEHDRLDVGALVKAGGAPAIADLGAYSTVTFTTGEVITVKGPTHAKLRLAGRYIE